MILGSHFTLFWSLRWWNGSGKLPGLSTLTQIGTQSHFLWMAGGGVETINTFLWVGLGLCAQMQRGRMAPWADNREEGFTSQASSGLMSLPVTAEEGLCTGHHRWFREGQAGNKPEGKTPEKLNLIEMLSSKVTKKWQTSTEMCILGGDSEVLCFHNH